MSNAILQNPRTCAHTVHTLKECFWFLPQVVGLIYLGGVAMYTWYMPGIYPSVWVEHIPAIYTEVCP